MAIDIKRVLRPAVVPFLLAAMFALTSISYSILGLPSPAELARLGRSLYVEYGLVVLFLASLLEGIFMVNIYLPGSFVIVLSVFLSDKSLSALSAIAMVTWTGFFLSSIANYALGATGGYRSLMFLGRKDTITRMQGWIEQKGHLAHFWASLHPNLQAVFMVCAGISRVDLAKAISRSAAYLALWVPLWTIFFSIALKRVEIDDSNAPLYVVVLLIAIGLILMAIEYSKERRRIGSGTSGP